jgi:O-antigen ligase
MLLWAVVVLLFTYSRSGLFILALLIIVAYLIFRSRSHVNPNVHRKTPQRRLLEVGTIVLVLLTTFVVVGSQNPYFSRLWRYYTEAKSRNRTYLEFIAVEQRLVYWQTAQRIFDSAPWLGVGMGNYAFYFDDALPNIPWHNQREIVRQITPTEGRDRLITPKNLPARLIAETGVIGTGAFLAFLLQLPDVRSTSGIPHPEAAILGLASFLA